MVDSFSWVKTVLMRDPAWQGGIDLDQDGVIRPEETIQNYNGDRFVGDPGDWEHFAVSNAEALQRRVAFFGWSAPFKTDNPIHELLAIESEIAKPEEVREAYAFAAKVLAIVRERLGDGQKRSNREKLKLVYSVIQELGVRLIDQKDTLLTANITAKGLDCDTSSFIVLAVAHEMGWPVSYIRAPQHAFVRWEERGERFNMDRAESHRDRFYRKKYGVSRESARMGVYLTSLFPHQLRAQFFVNRGTAKHDLGRDEEAIKDFNEALRLDPKSVTTYINRGIVMGMLGRNEEAIADFNEAIRLQPNSAAAYCYRGVAQHNLGRLEEAAQDYLTVLSSDPSLLWRDAYFILLASRYLSEIIAEQVTIQK